MAYRKTKQGKTGQRLLLTVSGLTAVLLYTVHFISLDGFCRQVSQCPFLHTVVAHPTKSDSCYLLVTTASSQNGLQVSCLYKTIKLLYYIIICISLSTPCDNICSTAVDGDILYVAILLLRNPACVSRIDFYQADSVSCCHIHNGIFISGIVQCMEHPVIIFALPGFCLC